MWGGNRNVWARGGGGVALSQLFPTREIMPTILLRFEAVVMLVYRPIPRPPVVGHALVLRLRDLKTPVHHLWAAMRDMGKSHGCHAVVRGMRW